MEQTSILSPEEISAYLESHAFNWNKLNETQSTIHHLRELYPDADLTDLARVHLYTHGFVSVPVDESGTPLQWDRRTRTFRIRKKKDTVGEAPKKRVRQRINRTPRVRSSESRPKEVKSGVPHVPLSVNDLHERDTQNLSEIRAFLDENGIEYTQPEPHRFTFVNSDPEAKVYEIFYVASHLYPIENRKLGIEGVRKDHFYRMFIENQKSNRFTCFTKDFEWLDPRKREVLKSYWMYAARKIKMNFSARDMEVREVPSREARDFESEHCFYGKRGASLNLGLYLKKDRHGFEKGTLMMIYTFGLNFFGRKPKIEVLRVGTRKFCNVAGGASKLLTHFVREYPSLRVGERSIVTDTLVFYSDSDHNSGTSMEKIGFEYRTSGSGFMNYWIEKGIVKHREPNKHKEILEEMAKGKVIAIPNAGVKTFLMRIDRSDYIRETGSLEDSEPEESQTLF